LRLPHRLRLLQPLPHQRLPILLRPLPLWCRATSPKLCATSPVPHSARSPLPRPPPPAPPPPAPPPPAPPPPAPPPPGPPPPGPPPPGPPPPGPPPPD